MRKMKKIASLMMALVMVMAMSVTAFASGDVDTGDEEEQQTSAYTITINEETEDYTYVAYQIFAGDLSVNATGGYVLSNITWGSGIDSTNSALLTTLTNKYSSTDAAVIAEEITTATEAAAFAEIVAGYLVSGEGSTSVYSETETNYTISVTEVGYYLIVNTSVPSGNYGYSDYILEVVGDTTTEPKNDSTPDFDKTVGNETDDATAAYAVGDSIPFTLTATLADSYSAYDEYKLVFTDTLSNGLTYDTNSLKVTVGGVTLTAGSDYTLTVDGQKITVTISDLKTADSNAVAGSEVVVSYTATLNDNAVSIENNTATLNFSNDPNGEGTGTTDDKVYVVTFTVKVNKVDKDNNALSGAGFTLYKYVGTETEGADENGYIAVDSEITGVTTFEFDGLSEGTYKLVETTTPDGYNTADPITFKIEATVAEDATETTGVNVEITGIEDFTISGETLTTSVVNQAGSSLPSTGGIGTTIFYVVGTVLVLGAAVVLITRRRMSSEA